VVGRFGVVNWKKSISSKDWRVRRTGKSGSAAACPRSGPVVRCLNRRSPAMRGCSKVHTAAREEELTGLPVPWNGGCGLLRPRADASLGLASRANPTPHARSGIPALSARGANRFPQAVEKWDHARSHRSTDGGRR